MSLFHTEVPPYYPLFKSKVTYRDCEACREQIRTEARQELIQEIEKVGEVYSDYIRMKLCEWQQIKGQK